MVIAILIITLFYIVLIGVFIIGFDRVPLFYNQDSLSKTKFSIIIPFRNEAENLPKLLKSIKHLNYPKDAFEIILVNDASEDTSVKEINQILLNSKVKFCIIKNKRTSNSPKKDAITLATTVTKYEWIISTDADCVLPVLWLDTYNAFILKNDVSFISGPVNYYNTNSFLTRFQALDFMSLIGATIGGFGIKKPFLCNGANLGYKKSFFKQLGGFEGNTNIASGDDIFLLEKAIKQAPKKVRFLKSKQAIVLTKPQPNLKHLINQRVRWAAKTTNYSSGFGKLTGSIVLVMNASLICYFMLGLFSLFSFKTLAYLFTIKFFIDFLLLYKTSVFLNSRNRMYSSIISSLLYPFFSTYISFISFFSTYKWKGREFKK